MKLIKVKEFGWCMNCVKTQKLFPKLKYYNIELGVEHIHTIPLCEECLLAMQDLQQEEAENESSIEF